MEWYSGDDRRYVSLGGIGKSLSSNLFCEHLASISLPQQRVTAPAEVNGADSAFIDVDPVLSAEVTC